jgi:hypothetical protein
MEKSFKPPGTNEAYALENRPLAFKARKFRTRECKIPKSVLLRRLYTGSR